jgi:hypothetical protein
MQIKGSNEELFPIIIESLLSWDDKMQSECARSFIEPIKLKLFSERNYIKIMQKGMNIIQEYLSLPEQEAGLDLWINVLGTVIEQVPIPD